MTRNPTRTILALFLLVSLSSLSLSRSPSAGSPQRPVSREIPAADSSATTEEAEWWEALRTAANEVRAKRDSKEAIEKFRELLLQGQQQNYRVPVPDRRFTALKRVEPQYTEAARHDSIRGDIIMKVEFRLDGFIGEIEILKSLRADLDQNSVEAARQTVFLPAVKDGRFVTSFGQIEMHFNIY